MKKKEIKNLNINSAEANIVGNIFLVIMILLIMGIIIYYKWF